MCISVGKQKLHECIAEGKIFKALQMIMPTLWQVDSAPVCQLTQWPLKGSEDDKT